MHPRVDESDFRLSTVRTDNGVLDLTVDDKWFIVVT